MSIVAERPGNEACVSGADVCNPAARIVSADTTSGTLSSLVALSSREAVFTESPTAETIGVFGGPIRPTIV